MIRSYVTSAIAGAFVLGLATAAVAATKGEFDNMCTMGLASHKNVSTNCSVNTIYKGKTYCFGNKHARTQFMKNPKANLAKAEAFYHKEHRAYRRPVYGWPAPEWGRAPLFGLLAHS